METILLTVGFMGIVVALLTPLKKTGAVVTLGSFFGYFYLLDPNSWIPILLFTLGILLIVMEVFIPDFGIIGIIGLLSLGTGLYWTIGDLSQMILDLSIAVIITGGLIFLLIKKGYSLQNINKLVLNTSNPSMSTKKTGGETKDIIKPGLIGEVKTPLRPTGKAVFNGGNDSQTVDVLSADGHISIGNKVIIESVHGTKITVKKAN